jgi:hypothetical protein
MHPRSRIGGIKVIPNDPAFDHSHRHHRKSKQRRHWFQDNSTKAVPSTQMPTEANQSEAPIRLVDMCPRSKDSDRQVEEISPSINVKDELRSSSDAVQTVMRSDVYKLLAMTDWSTRQDRVFLAGKQKDVENAKREFQAKANNIGIGIGKAEIDMKRFKDTLGSARENVSLLRSAVKGIEESAQALRSGLSQSSSEFAFQEPTESMPKKFLLGVISWMIWVICVVIMRLVFPSRKGHEKQSSQASAKNEERAGQSTKNVKERAVHFEGFCDCQLKAS